MRSMIRINLLVWQHRVHRRARASGRSGPASHTVACSVIVVATVVVMGWRFWSLRQESNQLQQELTAADQEIARSGSAGIDRVAAPWTPSDCRLEQHVGLVQGIRRGQSGPVHDARPAESVRCQRVYGWRSSNQDGDDVIVEG